MTVDSTSTVADPPPPPGPPAAPPRAAPSHAARWSAIAVGVVLVGLMAVFVAGLGGDSDGPITASPLDGRAAPELAGTGLDGGTVDLTHYRGSWVVVNFFATWCPPCVQEHPELISFSSRHQAAGDAVLLSVVFNDETANVASFFAAQGGTWPVLVDDDGSAAVGWAVTGVPESVLVAPNGIVVGKIKGGVTADALDGIINDLERQADGG